MNFLAHLHLASLAKSSLVGNLMADFVRGDPYVQYDETIASGIMMHRRVDKFVDDIEIIKHAKQHFSHSHLRIALIALDVVWDHFLSKNWADFSPDLSLHAFCLQAQKQISPVVKTMPQDIQEFNYFLWQEKWLEHYVEIDFIGDILQRMAKRRPKLAALATILPEIKQHYALLESTFYAFYPDLMKKAALKQL